MMEPLFEKLKSNAVAHRQCIILPESTEPRTLTAADKIIGDKVADIVLIGHADEIDAKVKELGLTHIGEARIINPDDEEANEKYAQLFYELRKSKGITIEDARKKIHDPLYLGCLLIKNGEADGQVAGALNTTGNVLRAAFQVLKTAPGVSVVSGAFIMILKGEAAKLYGQDGIMVFADCAVMPDPDEKQLAQVAVSTAKTAREIAGIDPVVAMLSFSTKGSASSDSVTKVANATAIAKEMDPTLKIDGELQADAAIVPSVGASKAPGSTVAGHANVLIFPNLCCHRRACVASDRDPQSNPSRSVFFPAGSITVPVPGIDEQKHFVQLVAQSDRAKQALLQSLKEARALQKKIVEDNFIAQRKEP